MMLSHLADMDATVHLAMSLFRKVLVVEVNGSGSICHLKRCLSGVIVYERLRTVTRGLIF
jgi:hypothetical protein